MAFRHPRGYPSAGMEGRGAVLALLTALFLAFSSCRSALSTDTSQQPTPAGCGSSGCFGASSSSGRRGSLEPLIPPSRSRADSSSLSAENVEWDVISVFPAEEEGIRRIKCSSLRDSRGWRWIFGPSTGRVKLRKCWLGAAQRETSPHPINWKSNTVAGKHVSAFRAGLHRVLQVAGSELEHLIRVHPRETALKDPYAIFNTCMHPQKLDPENAKCHGEHSVHFDQSVINEYYEQNVIGFQVRANLRDTFTCFERQWNLIPAGVKVIKVDKRGNVLPLVFDSTSRLWSSSSGLYVVGGEVPPEVLLKGKEADWKDKAWKVDGSLRVTLEKASTGGQGIAWRIDCGLRQSLGSLRPNFETVIWPVTGRILLPYNPAKMKLREKTYVVRLDPSRLFKGKREEWRNVRQEQGGDIKELHCVFDSHYQNMHDCVQMVKGDLGFSMQGDVYVVSEDPKAMGAFAFKMYEGRVPFTDENYHLNYLLVLNKEDKETPGYRDLQLKKRKKSTSPALYDSFFHLNASVLKIDEKYCFKGTRLSFDSRHFSLKLSPPNDDWDIGSEGPVDITWGLTKVTFKTAGRFWGTRKRDMKQPQGERLTLRKKQETSPELGLNSIWCNGELVKVNVDDLDIIITRLPARANHSAIKDGFLQKRKRR